MPWIADTSQAFGSQASLTLVYSVMMLIVSYNYKYTKENCSMVLLESREVILVRKDTAYMWFNEFDQC